MQSRVTSHNSKNSFFTTTHTSFYFLHAFLGLRHREIDGNSQRSIAAHLLFTVDPSVVIL